MSILREQPAILFWRLERLAAQYGIRGLLGSASQTFAIRILGAALSYTSTVLLARWLGSRDFGIYAYVLVVVTLLGLASSFGFSSSALRFVTTYLALNKLRRLLGYLRVSYQTVLLLGIFVSLAGAGLLTVLRDVIDPHYVQPLLVGLLCVPTWTLLNQLEVTARAFDWMNVAYVPGYILRPIGLMAIVGGFVWFGASADSVTAVWALAGACGVAAIVQGLMVYSRLRSRLAGVRPVFHPRQWFAASAEFLAIDSFRILLDNTDLLLIGWLLDPHSVAIYFAVVRSSSLLGFVSFSVMARAAPKFAQISSTGMPGELQKFVTSVILIMLWPTLIAAIGLGCVGTYVLSLFGADYVSGFPAMLVVLVGLVLRTATLPVEYLLNMTGHHRDTVRVYAVAAIANIILNFLLISSFGIIGAAIGSYAALIGGNIWLYLMVKKRLGVTACVFRI